MQVQIYILLLFYYFFFYILLKKEILSNTGTMVRPPPYHILYSKLWRLLWATYQIADAMTDATTDVTMDVDVSVQEETAVSGGLSSFYSSVAVVMAVHPGDLAQADVVVTTAIMTITAAVLLSGLSYYPASVETALFSNRLLLFLKKYVKCRDDSSLTFVRNRESSRYLYKDTPAYFFIYFHMIQ